MTLPRAERELRSLSFGFRSARAIMAAVRLGILECLADGPMQGSEIAEACNLDERGARALLAALVSLGILDRRPVGFALSEAARNGLLEDGVRSRQHTILHDLWHWPLWSKLEESVQTGQPAKRDPGDPFFSDPEVLKAFLPNLALGMEETSREEGAELSKTLALPAAGRVLDLGGGRGQIASLLARAHPGARFEIMELAPVASLAKATIAKAGLADRIRVRPGDFLSEPLDPDGQGFDLVLLSRILMGQKDDVARNLLTRAHDALVPGGKVAVLEFRRCGPTAGVAALLDLDMLLAVGGAVRSELELVALLVDAGFRDTRSQPLGEWGLLIEADA